MRKVAFYSLATLFWIGLIFLGAAVDNLSLGGIAITLSGIILCMIAFRLIDKEEV